MEDATIKKTIELKAQTEKLDELLEIIETDMEKSGCPPEKRTVTAICAEEIFVNIASYAYGEAAGIARIDEEIQGGSISLCFQDQGRPYNPLAKEDPDTTLSAQEREIGGLGVFMVKNMMDSVAYEYRDGWNRLTMTISW